MLNADFIMAVLGLISLNVHSATDVVLKTLHKCLKHLNLIDGVTNEINMAMLET
jgi:hypothetical protein